MKPLRPLAALSLAAVCAAHLPAATARMPVDEVRAGMRGVGVTVFDGSRREEFGVEILGVLRNVLGPRRDVIIARLSGGPLAETGVMQGMSGSPVYIDGRLAGAVSYALGSFPKEPIAGITPIEEMVSADAHRMRTARAAVRPPPFPVTAPALGAALRGALDPGRPFALRPEHVRASGLLRADGRRPEMLLRPIATPMVLSGFDPQVQALWASAFDAGGFVTAIGGGQVAPPAGSGKPLQPGDPIGAALVRGDLTMAGAGTVTLVEDGRVHAFGHPFYNLGPIRFAMTRASVTTLLPSLALSSKIAAIGEVVGALDQDRAAGIFGALGPGPEMIPVRVTLDAPERGLARAFSFEVVEDQLFTPLLTYTGVLSTLRSWTRELGASTYAVAAATRVRGHADVTFEDVYSGETALVSAAGAIANPLTTLLNNAIAPVDLDGIAVGITAWERPRTAAIERVWLDAPRVAAGETIRLHVLARSFRGDALIETVLVDVPPRAAGRLELVVSDAPQLAARESREGRSARTPDTIDQVIRTLNEAPRNDRIYVKLTSAQPGAVVSDAAMPALPPSVLAVLEGGRSGSGLRRLGRATLGEWEIRTGYAVSGSRVLSFDVDSPW